MTELSDEDIDRIADRLALRFATRESAIAAKLVTKGADQD